MLLNHASYAFTHQQNKFMYSAKEGIIYAFCWYIEVWSILLFPNILWLVIDALSLSEKAQEYSIIIAKKDHQRQLIRPPQDPKKQNTVFVSHLLYSNVTQMQIKRETWLVLIADWS